MSLVFLQDLRWGSASYFSRTTNYFLSSSELLLEDSVSDFGQFVLSVCHLMVNKFLDWLKRLLVWHHLVRLSTSTRGQISEHLLQKTTTLIFRAASDSLYGPFLVNDAAATLLFSACKLAAARPFSFQYSSTVHLWSGENGWSWS